MFPIFDPFTISKFPISRYHFSGSDCIVTLHFHTFRFLFISILLFRVTLSSQFDWRLQSPSTKLRTNLSNYAVYIYTRIASHMYNYMLRVLESANQTTSIYAQIMEQQKILYTHKHCEIIHIRNLRFLFSFFSI
jgi:hypothetical protein